ncbi:Fe-S cluster assembly sulfur transfer protein SufU [Nanoarchaeota archaeon]
MENILDHYKNPRNFGNLKNPDIKHMDSNTSCGDDIEIMVKLNKDVVQDVKFKGKGCAISNASASLLTEKIKGLKLSEVKKLKNEDIFKLLGIKLSPIRMKCALLSLQVLTAGISKYEHKL